MNTSVWWNWNRTVKDRQEIKANVFFIEMFAYQLEILILKKYYVV